MIILHTSVVTEALRPNGDPSVTEWLDGQAAETLYLTAIGVAELLANVTESATPEGEHDSEVSLSDLMQHLFGGRILAFDHLAALPYVHLTSRARAAGHDLSTIEAQTAAIAAARGFTVATRDTAPFVAAGVPTIDPWHAAAGSKGKS